VRPKILVVDDEPANLELLVRALRRRYDVVTAQSGKEALELLRGERFAAILSDQRMPNMTGTEFLAEARRLVPDTVRMIVTGYAPEKESLDAINLANVHTYLTKPVSAETVARAVADAVELHEAAVKNAELLRELAATNRELAEAKRLLELSLDERTRELFAANQKLEALARLDPLTGVWSARTFVERLGEELARVERYGGVFALALCGPAGGDARLVALAQLLAGKESLALRPSDVVARWGDDVLAVLMPGTDREGARAVCRRIRGAGAAVSFGVAESSVDGHTASELLETAERELAQAGS
jgi:PleD family two-component response regulator